jgi:hypothetical protein
MPMKDFISTNKDRDVDQTKLYAMFIPFSGAEGIGTGDGKTALLAP